MGITQGCCQPQQSNQGQLPSQQVYRLRNSTQDSLNSMTEFMKPNLQNKAIAIKLYQKKQIIEDPQELLQLNNLIFQFSEMQQKINRPLKIDTLRIKRNQRQDVYYLNPLKALYLGEWVYHIEKKLNVPGGIGRLFSHNTIYEGIFKTIFLAKQQIQYNKTFKSKETLEEANFLKASNIKKKKKDIHKSKNKEIKQTKYTQQQLKVMEEFNVVLDGEGRVYSPEVQMEGEFCEGVLHGKGNFKRKDIDYQYEGTWKYGNKHGKGKQSSQSFVYEGDFVQNIRQGKGKLRMIAGAKEEHQIQIQEQKFQLKYRDLAQQMIRDAKNVQTVRKNRQKVIKKSLQALMQNQSEATKIITHFQKWKRNFRKIIQRCLQQLQKDENSEQDRLQTQKMIKYYQEDLLNKYKQKIIKQSTRKQYLSPSQEQQRQKTKEFIVKKIQQLVGNIHRQQYKKKEKTQTVQQTKNRFIEGLEDIVEQLREKQKKMAELIKCAHIGFDEHHMIFDNGFIMEHQHKNNFAEIYNGEIHEGQFHGKGKYVWSNGKTYNGQWKQGKMHGHGQFSWPNGAAYEGQYNQDQRHGMGIMIWSSFKRYQGQWAYGYKHGYGQSIQIDEIGENLTIRGDLWDRNEIRIQIFEASISITEFNLDSDDLRQKMKEQQQKLEEQQEKKKRFFWRK